MQAIKSCLQAKFVLRRGAGSFLAPADFAERDMEWRAERKRALWPETRRRVDIICPAFSVSIISSSHEHNIFLASLAPSLSLLLSTLHDVEEVMHYSRPRG